MAHHLKNDFIKSFTIAHQTITARYASFSIHLGLSFLLAIFIATMSAYLLGQLVADIQSYGVHSSMAIQTIVFLILAWILNKVLEQIANILNAYITSKSESSMCEALFAQIAALPHSVQKKLDTGEVLANIDRSRLSFSNVTHSLFLTICPIVFEILVRYF